MSSVGGKMALYISRGQLLGPMIVLGVTVSFLPDLLEVLRNCSQIFDFLGFDKLKARGEEAVCSVWQVEAVHCKPC